MRSDAELEQELNKWMFALQCDWLRWRLARGHGLPDEEQHKHCLASLDKLRDLLGELEVVLTDRQEGDCRQQSMYGADCVLQTI